MLTPHALVALQSIAHVAAVHVGSEPTAIHLLHDIRKAVEAVLVVVFIVGLLIGFLVGRVVGRRTR